MYAKHINQPSNEHVFFSEEATKHHLIQLYIIVNKSDVRIVMSTLPGIRTYRLTCLY